MFLALYFATEEVGTDVVANDNDCILPDAFWYATALQRLADNGRKWNDRHTATLQGAPVR